MLNKRHLFTGEKEVSQADLIRCRVLYASVEVSSTTSFTLSWWLSDGVGSKALVRGRGIPFDIVALLDGANTADGGSVTNTDHIIANQVFPIINLNHELCFQFNVHTFIHKEHVSFLKC